MYNITRKDTLARNLNRAQNFLPQQYDFFPKTFYLPNEMSQLQRFMDKQGKYSTFIHKPPASAQGKGIKLFDQISQLDPEEQGVVQEYIDNPYLIDGYKFDLRIYVVVLQVAPFPIIVWYNDGIARLCTNKYEKPNKQNMNNIFMHLTNYAINRQNQLYINSQDDNNGSKQTLDSVLQRIKRDGGDSNKVLQQIKDICLKTIFMILPTLQQSYSSLRPGYIKLNNCNDPYTFQGLFYGSNCFEILGFDILITDTFKPYLIEVNHSPSFACDSLLDIKIKKRLIDGVLSMINCQQSDKIIYKDFCEGRFNINQSYDIKSEIKVPQYYNRKINGRNMKIKTPSFQTVLEHYQKVIQESNGLFQLIYPLNSNQKDIYRESLFVIKNNFLGESTVQLYNKFIPIMPQEYFSQQYQKQHQKQQKTLTIQQKQIFKEKVKNKLKQHQQPRNLTYQQQLEYGISNKVIKLSNNQTIPQGVPKTNNMEFNQILQQRFKLLQQKGFEISINNLFNQVQQIILNKQ